MDQRRLMELKKFFFSEYFTPEMLLQYLLKHKDQPEPLELLYERLLTWPDQIVSLYVPQLCCLLIKYDMPQVRQFFLVKSMNSISLFFNLYWSIYAYSSLENNVKKLDKIEKFQRQMEMQMVNGQFSEDSIKDLDQKQVVQVLEHNYHQKESRSNYFTEMQKFIGTLIRMSLVLKQFPKEDRKNHLKLFIKQSNQTLLKIQKIFHNSFKGITLPIMQICDDQPNSNTVVNIIEKNYVCFHTKKRVPYLILLETIDAVDFEQCRSPNVNSRQQNQIQIEEIVEQNLNDPKFENFMAQIQNDEQQIYHDALNKIMKMEVKSKRQSEIWKTVDKIVQTQKQKTDDIHRSSENLSITETQTIRKNSLNFPVVHEVNTRKVYSVEKNDEKSEQFYQDMCEKLPPSKQGFLKRFKKKSKKILWEQSWEEKILKFRRKSPYSEFPSYKIRPVIIKGGDDLRQELFAIQIMSWFNQIFEKADLKLFMRPYNIIVTSASSGIVEYIPNTMSIDALKKKFGNGTKTLLQIYKEIFGNVFEEAQKNFIESLASYSLFTYLMQVKDRHNGNLLIDDRGHIIHIDFGFILQTSPGGVNFESAPFKLTYEYVELMKGKESDFFGYFRTLMIKGMLELKKYVQDFIGLIQIMSEGSELSCFKNLDLKQWIGRFYQQSTDKECMDYVDKLINQSLHSWRTAQYDNFQKRTNGIIP